MRFLSCLLAFLLIVIASCKPSMNTIYQYESSQRLKSSIVIVELNQDWEDQALLEKYGKDKKAERIAKRQNKRNEALLSAFSQNFNYTEVAYCYDLDKSLDSGKFYDSNLEVIDLNLHDDEVYLVDIYEDAIENGDNSQPALFAELFPLVQKGKSERISVSMGGSWSKWNVKYIVNVLDARIDRLYKKSEKAKTRN